MLYYEFAVGEKTYKLRLNTRNTVELEKKLGCNPLAIFGNGDTVPTVSAMAHILHSSLQAFHHNITIDKAYEIFDAYLAEGNVMTDFIPVILEVYKVSGLIKTPQEEQEEEEEEKN